MNHIRAFTGAFVLTLIAAGGLTAWGETGHRIIADAATADLPGSMPSFFTDAADQLAYLGPEPDRWRGDMTAMDEAFKYDHYIDLENVPEGALDSPDRFTYLAALYESGLEKPERDAGFLPYRMYELYQRVVNGFARWRMAETPEERRWIEERVINDAGILGHYIADASQPHHSTIHFNGWAADAPNPRGFTTERDFHWRFESLFVNAHITYPEVARAVPAGVVEIDDPWDAIVGYIMETNDLVEPLYELEQEHGFDPDAQPAAATQAFAIDRLAAGATMLRSLWYSAWQDSQQLARDSEREAEQEQEEQEEEEEGEQQAQDEPEAGTA